MSDTFREPASADVVATLLLRIYREPVQYRARMLHAGQLLGNIDLVLRLALGRAVAFSEPKLRGPGIAAEIEHAAVFYVQQCLFRERATPYEVLGLAPNASPVAVRENFRLLMQLIHPDRQSAKSVWPVNFAARANRAYGVLKNPETRTAYDQSEAARRASKAATSVPAQGASPASNVGRRAPVARRPVRVSRLPEWLTSSVGGFFREHPGFMVFAGMISMSIVLIGVVAWGELSGVLARGTPEILDAIGSRAVPAPTALAPAPGTAPSGTAAAGSTAPGASEPPAGVVPAVAVAEPDPVRAVELPGFEHVAAVAPASVEGSQARSAAEVEALVASFITAYESGRLHTFAGLFDDDARTNRRRGRPAIRSEYEELFRLSAWRRMSLTQLSWHDAGDHIDVKGEFTVRIGWRDGREVEERVRVDMDVVRSGGRTVITRLFQQTE